MKTQSLCGVWQYRVGKGSWREQEVPFSRLAVGHSECLCRFDRTEPAPIVLLKLEGITYSAKVFLNGEHLGDMVPYSEYTFDVSHLVKPTDNELLVEIEDISPDFGPSEGWENFGGIIRDVSLLYAKEGYLRDVFFHSTLKNNYRDAEFTVELQAECQGDFTYRVTLSKEGNVVSSYTQGANEESLSHAVQSVSLWSVEDPALYTLSVVLEKDGAEIDVYQCQVGFREIKCDRHRFVINGKPVFLRGVCKHEMIGNSGHVVSPERIEEDLRRIKATGCNFVRLVHYPHQKATLEIADRIGLMVSEEPGLWWSDTANPNVSGGSLEVLKRTILRDRNHPSIAFWLCFNECVFTEQFLIDSANTCRKYDPTRLVSGANCMSDADTLKYYNLCNFDFYTMHPYAQTFDRAATSAKLLVDKPLLFTEYGGYYLYDNPHLFKDFITKMVGLYHQNSDEGALAGAFFWFWAGINDFNRGKPACIDGELTEGLLTADQTPTLIFDTFCTAWDEAENAPRAEALYQYTPMDSLDKKALPCLGSGTDYGTLLEAAMERYPQNRVKMRRRRITVGPKLQEEEVRGILKTPLILSDGMTLEFAAEGAHASTLTLLGMTAMPKGYPIGGDYGEVAAELIVLLENGEQLGFPIRNGIELTNAMTTLGSSRIQPIGEHLTTFAKFSYEKNFENYQINRYDVELGKERAIRSVSLRSANHGYNLLIYGVFL